MKPPQEMTAHSLSWVRHEELVLLLIVIIIAVMSTYYVPVTGQACLTFMISGLSHQPPPYKWRPMY